jgi:hypothetical protein
MMSSRPPKASHRDLACGALESTLWASSIVEAQARLVPPKLSTKQGPAKQIRTPSKDLKSKYSQIKQMLQDPIQLTKFRYGRGVIKVLLGRLKP